VTQPNEEDRHECELRTESATGVLRIDYDYVGMQDTKNKIISNACSFVIQLFVFLPHLPIKGLNFLFDLRTIRPPSKATADTYLLDRAATPGSSFPSSNSSDAPPPVDTWLSLSSTPYLAATVAVSPPPIITILPFCAA
jgi:hypothetical protein